MVASMPGPLLTLWTCCAWESHHYAMCTWLSGERSFTSDSSQLGLLSPTPGKTISLLFLFPEQPETAVQKHTVTRPDPPLSPRIMKPQSPVQGIEPRAARLRHRYSSVNELPLSLHRSFFNRI